MIQPKNTEINIDIVTTGHIVSNKKEEKVRFETTFSLFNNGNLNQNTVSNCPRE